MKTVTDLMINDYGLKKLKMDMMGYSVVHKNDYSFHHLIVPKRDCRKEGIPSDGYVEWNGAILSYRTSHPYIHAIEEVERRRFVSITKELVEINKKGYVDRENLLRIYEMLEEFELRHSSDCTKSGKRLIKPGYKIRPNLYDEEVCERLEDVKKMVLTRRG